VGIADRTYMRGPAPPHISLGASWTVRFIVLLVLAFVAVKGGWGWFGRDLRGPLALSREAILEGRVHTLLTAAFVHADVWHVLFNCLGLWFFGKLVEETVGSAKFIAFVLLGAVLSHLPFLAVEFATGGHTRTIGASGVVLASIVFAAFRYPSSSCRCASGSSRSSTWSSTSWACSSRAGRRTTGRTSAARRTASSRTGSGSCPR
jgi:membrane associated rhomboid family serine protease